MPHASFVHLRVRTAFSLLESTVRPDDLVKRCRALAMPAVAVTDRANLYAAMAFSAAAAKAGIQPILGAMIPLALPEERGRTPLRPPPTPHLALLAKDAAGWRSLSRLLSRAYLAAGSEDGLRLTTDDLAAEADGLICLAGGAEGPLGAALARGDEALAGDLAERLAAIYPDRLYVELQRHGLELERRVEPGLVDLAMRLGLPMVAANDVRVVDEAMVEAQDALVCIAEGDLLSEAAGRRPTVEYRLKTAAEMAALFADLPEAVANTLVVAQRCAFAAPSRAPILPTFAPDEAALMRDLAGTGLERRLVAGGIGGKAAGPYRERLAYELGVITQMEFAGYFLIVSDFIRWAKAQGIPVGPGRGSGAGSVVAWALEITDLDPLRFGLLFERFLNPERVSMPDFDIDFCEERRGEVINYVRDRYGADRVAQIITFGTLQARAALRDVGRVLGLPFGQVDRFCKLVPANPANPVTLKQALDLEPRLGELMAAEPAVARMMKIAQQLEGLPRNASTHAAGVVIADRPLEELVPLTRDPRALLPATQFNMKDVEKAGLVKFDFLGLSTLTLLARAEDLLAGRGTPVDFAGLPLDDRRTYESMSRAETVGIFQLESGGMRDALRRLRPDCFDDIVAMVSLYRPGPMDNIPRYTDVKHGLVQPEYQHPLMEPILAATNGVIIYQEQVMEIARRLAGYTLGGADLLRRAMGKKIKAEMDAQRQVFIDGAVSNGLTAPLAEEIFAAVAKFASYGFNKSHAAAYALLAYQTAWLKANHAVVFYAAAMTTEMTNRDKLVAFRQEMAGLDVTLLPPDVNASAVAFTVEERPGGSPAVRFALAAVKGVGSGAMAALVEERRHGGPFADLNDLCRRVGAKALGKRLLLALVEAGALDGLEPNRHLAGEMVEPALRWAQAVADSLATGQNSLFGATAVIPPPPPRPPAMPDWPDAERLERERATLGFYMSAHPLDAWAAVLERLEVTPIASLTTMGAPANRQRLKLTGVVTAKQEKVSDRGRFGIVQLSDRTGQVELRLFAELLAQTRELLEGGEPLLIDVEVSSGPDQLRVQALRVEPLAAQADRRAALVEIHVDGPAAAAALAPLLAGQPAGLRVRLVIGSGAEAVHVALPEAYTLAWGRRADLLRAAGVRGLQERNLH